MIYRVSVCVYVCVCVCVCVTIDSLISLELLNTSNSNCATIKQKRLRKLNLRLKVDNYFWRPARVGSMGQNVNFLGVSRITVELRWHHLQDFDMLKISTFWRCLVLCAKSEKRLLHGHF